MVRERSISRRIAANAINRKLRKRILSPRLPAVAHCRELYAFPFPLGSPLSSVLMTSVAMKVGKNDREKDPVRATMEAAVIQSRNVLCCAAIL